VRACVRACVRATIDEFETIAHNKFAAL